MKAGIILTLLLFLSVPSLLRLSGSGDAGVDVATATAAQACRCSGFLNGCAGPTLLLFYGGSAPLTGWQITRSADRDSRVINAPAGSTWTDRVGCDWSSDYTLTAISNGRAVCSTTTQGMQPHSSCFGTNGAQRCANALQCYVQDAARQASNFIVGRGALAAAYTTDLPFAQASSLPLPTELAGVRVLVEGRAVGIHSIASNQINFQTPPDLQGESHYGVEIVRADGSAAFGRLYAKASWPSLFSASANGQGIAAGTWLDVAGQSGLLTQPMTRIGATYMTVWLTGLELHNVTATIAGRNATVQYAGQSAYAGVQQVNVFVSPDLPRGELAFSICGGGQCSPPLSARF